MMEDEPEIQVFSKRSKKLKGARSDAPAAGKESTQNASQISKAELAQATDAAAQQVSPPSAANTGCIQFILWSKEQLGSVPGEHHILSYSQPNVIKAMTALICKHALLMLRVFPMPRISIRTRSMLSLAGATHKLSDDQQPSLTGFRELGITAWLDKVCSSLGMKTATAVQRGCIPAILQVRCHDVSNRDDTGFGEASSYPASLNCIWPKALCEAR